MQHEKDEQRLEFISEGKALIAILAEKIKTNKRSNWRKALDRVRMRLIRRPSRRD